LPLIPPNVSNASFRTVVLLLLACWSHSGCTGEAAERLRERVRQPRANRREFLDQRLAIFVLPEADARRLTFADG